MDINEITNEIVHRLYPHKFNTDRSWIYVRCPYCGDSKKDANHVHFGIQLTPPYYFHCLRCDSGGPLTKRVLNDIGIFDNDLIVSINKANKIIYKSNNPNYKSILSKPKKLFIESYDSNYSKQNLAYFNKRFGTNLDISYVTEKFRCLLDPIKFFAKNNITTKYNYRNYIGFVSSDESYCIFRDTSGKAKIRYNNLKLTPKGIESSKIYNIKSEIDVMQDKITLVMTEGIFDIIGIYLVKYKDTPEEKNTIFAASCGKGYNSVINHFVRKGFLNLDIVIYSDNDVGRQFFEDLKESNYIIRNKQITVYYNELSKDCGVPAEQIKLRKMIV